MVIDDAAGNGPVGSPSVNGSSYYIIDVTIDIENIAHNVFIEEGTATWCQNCPVVSEILYELFTESDLSFYYVNMIEDENNKAKSRLDDDYNIYGYPTVYIDGGYEVIVGGDKDKSFFEEEIDKVTKRDVKIDVNVTAEFNESDDEIETSVIIKNYENQAYNGNLEVYLTEIVSSIQDYNGNPYHYAFVDYITEESIEISANGEKTITKEYNVSSFDVENLMVIAVVFNSESNEQYSNPEKNGNKFDAYYADACDGTYIVEERNLPPEVGITNIVKEKLHILGNPIIRTLFRNTVIIGKITINVQASDESGIDRVEFYIDNVLVENDTISPYKWTWDKLTETKFKHTIKVIAYDETGKSSSATMDVIAFLPIE